jgi:hypothetical protein
MHSIADEEIDIYTVHLTGSDVLAKAIAYEKTQGARFEPDTPNQIR